MIRAANTLDLLRLFARGPQPVLQFDVPLSLIRPRPGLRTALGQLASAFVPQSNPNNPIYVYINKGRILAYVRAWMDDSSGGQGPSWTLIELGNPRHTPLSADMTSELLERFCQAAGQYGAARMFARISEGSALLDTFYTLAFQPYAEETVWARLALNERRPATAQHQPRPLRRRDAWAVYQLYLGLTPEKVQHSEGYSSRHWQWGKQRPAWGGIARRFVWDDGRGINAYLEIDSGPRGHEMRIMTRPDSSSDHNLTYLAVDYALELLQGRGERGPFYCTVRDYQSGLSEVLQERGFYPLLRQTALVKHIAVHVRQTAPALRPVWSNPIPAEAVPAGRGGLVVNQENTSPSL